MSDTRTGNCKYKFIVDAMLGDLAKWLRLLGFDTLYFSSISDSQLYKKMLETKRVLLTSDKRFYSNIKDKNNVIYVPITTDIIMKLKIVLRTLNIQEDCITDLIGTRCVYCNQKLVKVNSINDVKTLVKKYKIKEIPYRLTQTEDFWFCSHCKKLYWKGRMWRRINETISKIFCKEEK